MKMLVVDTEREEALNLVSLSVCLSVGLSVPVIKYPSTTGFPNVKAVQLIKCRANWLLIVFCYCCCFSLSPSLSLFPVLSSARDIDLYMKRERACLLFVMRRRWVAIAKTHLHSLFTLPAVPLPRTASHTRVHTHIRIFTLAANWIRVGAETRSARDIKAIAIHSDCK